MFRLLLAQLQQEELLTYDYIYTGISQYRDILLKKYPGMKEWMPEKLFQLDPLWKEGVTINIWDRNSNNAGSFLAVNLETPTTVMKGCATEEGIIKELIEGRENNFPYTHVGFSVFVEGYSDFIRCARRVKQFDKKIITIAGNVGCLFEGTENYVDYVCRPQIDENGDIISGI